MHKKARKLSQPNRQGAKKPVIHGSQTRDLRYKNTKTIWKGIHSRVGLNTLGSKVQVSHISSWLRLEKGAKRGSKTANNPREERTFKLKENGCENKEYRLWQDEQYMRGGKNDTDAKRKEWTSAKSVMCSQLECNDVPEKWEITWVEWLIFQGANFSATSDKVVLSFMKLELIMTSFVERNEIIRESTSSRTQSQLFRDSMASTNC